MDDIRTFNGAEVQELKCPICGRIQGKYHYDPIVSKPAQVAEDAKATWQKPYITVKCHNCKTYLKVKF
jgi:ribosomal protein S27E